jgi:hypothetical protein
MTALRDCPSCGSEFIQPLRWKERADGEVLVELRCPECLTVMEACHSQQDMQELDRHQTRSRDELRAAYERSVLESMSSLAARMHDALERDLIGPDDFAPPRRLRRAA